MGDRNNFASKFTTKSTSSQELPERCKNTVTKKPNAKNVPAEHYTLVPAALFASKRENKGPNAVCIKAKSEPIVFTFLSPKRIKLHKKSKVSSVSGMILQRTTKIFWHLG